MNAGELTAWAGEATIAQAVLVAGAIIAVATLCWRVWPWVKGFVALVSALGDLPRFLVDTRRHARETTAVLTAVKDEVLPNHGGSMRDAVDRGERASAELAVRLGAVEQKLADLEDTLTRDNTRIAVLEAVQPRDARGRFMKEEG
ncbi:MULTISPECIES: hypothetical protein [Mycetocola]|uniref:hypothetical protein n=1 Tax=Mycetocola TaxID=76634 RepID=UPI0004BF02C6|nr:MULTISPECIES: hypothetical protein [Mycetocola]